jgi:hypothetical protein
VGFRALFADNAFAKKVRFTENCSPTSVQWRRDVSTGMFKSMKMELRPSISLIDLEGFRLILV